jgi:hypothetical protein
MSSKNLAQKGALRTRAFRDDNGDGLRNKNEPFLEEVKVLSQAYGKTPYLTRIENTIPLKEEHLTGTGRWIDVILDPSSMPDPSFYPANKGRSVLLRSGVISTLDLPVMITADIEGKVNLKIGQKTRAVPNITVQIIQQGGENNKEKIIAEAKTEFDGIYVISHIPVGTYQVRILPEQAKQIGVQQTIIPTITLTHETDFLENVNIELVRP